VIALPTAPWAHYLGDLCAWVAAAAAALIQHRCWPDQARGLARTTEPGYFLMLAVCGLIGAWLAGTLNSMPVSLAPSHSVAGALAGGILGVELWKLRHGVRRSTGGAFVLPLCVGIAVGRMGCLFSGLADFTFGTPAHLPWAVDFGDGVGRHPVQAYEALAMALFAAAYVHGRRVKADWAAEHGFHAFVIYYAAQRFVWEFIKPYPAVAGPFNLFHLLAVGMIAYGIVWWRRGAGPGAIPGVARAEGGSLCVPQPDDQPLRDLP